MSLDELKKKFIVSDDILKSRIESLIEKALSHCAVTKNGLVHIADNRLPARDKIKLVLVARALASQLDPQFSAEVSVSDLVRSTGIEPKQLSARINEVVKERFASTTARGVYTANPQKIEAYLDSLSGN